jgi:pimeloyl-ACP methyl ester carboxylesterase
MSTRGVRGNWLDSIKRILRGFLAIFIILLVSGLVYQAIATEIDKRNYPPPGQLVDVGGYKMHIYCIGENTGGRPTVVFETGLGGVGSTSSAWSVVQPEIAKTTRACAYDRAGLGWSDPGPRPRDAKQIASELHTLLQNSHTPGPYVLVGWSYGGLYIRVYANQYRDEVTGMVLVDSSSPEQCTSTPAWQAVCASSDRTTTIASFLAPFGVLRIMNLIQPPMDPPGPQHAAALASFAETKDWQAQNAEHRASFATYSEVLSSKPLGAIPLMVLTATDHGAAPELEQGWQAFQAGYIALSTNSVQRVVNGATHDSLMYGLKDSEETIQGILQVVEAARTGEHLKP